MCDQLEFIAENFADFDQLAAVAARDDDLHGSRQRLALLRAQLGDAFLRQCEQCVEFFAAERVAFRRTLHFDKAAAVVHHDVHVGIAVAVFGVIEIEHRRAAVNADGNRGDRSVDRIAFQQFLRLEPIDRIDERHICAGDRSGPRAAVGLDHVAIQRDGAFAQVRAVNTRAQAASDQALDFHACGRLVRRAPLRAAMRSFVARGSMPYSAVTQPSPLPRRNGGTFSSTLAVHSTRVSPNETSTEPSAWRVKRRWIETARS